MRAFVCCFVVNCGLLAATCLPGYSQSDTPTPDQPSSATHPSAAKYGDSGRVGIGVKVSLLGIGGEAAVRVTHRTNVRAGFNAFSYSRGFNKDGIAYNGQVSFRNFEAHYDIFPWAKSFHISPGVVVYAADPITATESVPAGQSFTLGGVNYVSGDSTGANPITGTGKIVFHRAAPTITVGWGNLVSRKEGKHFTVPFEIGAAFQGSPQASLALAGTACDSTFTVCRNAGTDPTIQSNVVSEQNKITSDLKLFKVYPIISIGLGYKF